MLRDELVRWCNSEYKKRWCDGQCFDCDNKEFCKLDCDKCLDQVHWYPRNGGRPDYTCYYMLLKYVVRFCEKYSLQIENALEMIDISKYPRFNILSIGCGPAPDLFAFEEKVDNKKIYYKGYDRNRLWDNIHMEIKDLVSYRENIDVRFRYNDIFDIIFDDEIIPGIKYNVLVIQYLLSHLFNTNQHQQVYELFNKLIEKIIFNRYENSPFLIVITDIDSGFKGRNSWYHFLDMLEENGFYGNAYARSHYPDGDLGKIRWSEDKCLETFQHISYHYQQNESKHDCAQLVIELK